MPFNSTLKLDDLEPASGQRLRTQQNNMRQLEDLRRSEAEKVRLQNLQKKLEDQQRCGCDKRRH